VCLRHTCMTAGPSPGYRGPGESGAACSTGWISTAGSNPARRVAASMESSARATTLGNAYAPSARAPASVTGASDAQRAVAEGYVGAADSVI